MTIRLEVVEAEHLATAESIDNAMATVDALMHSGLAQLSVIQALLQETDDLRVQSGGTTIVCPGTACEVLNTARVQVLDALLQFREVTDAVRARGDQETPRQAA